MAEMVQLMLCWPNLVRGALICLAAAGGSERRLAHSALEWVRSGSRPLTSSEAESFQTRGRDWISWMTLASPPLQSGLGLGGGQVRIMGWRAPAVRTTAGSWTAKKTLGFDFRSAAGLRIL